MLSSPQVEIDQADSSVQSQGIKSAQRESVEGGKKAPHAITRRQAYQEVRNHRLHIVDRAFVIAFNQNLVQARLNQLQQRYRSGNLGKQM
jgi:flagellar biosynthesis/type III secretory pathway protein FliH